MKGLISNPPFNLKWDVPPFAQMQRRFFDYGVPPKSNANYAFILTALEEHDRCVFILPNSIAQSNLKEEQEIRKKLIEKNLIEAVIQLPDNMFESTDIGVCILILDKNKTTATTEIVDAREKYDIVSREQKGQYGGKAHTNRTYKKSRKVLQDDVIEEIILCIQERRKTSFSMPITIEMFRDKKYTLSAAAYMDCQMEEVKHRAYGDIVKDINRIMNEKNTCKLTINETLAKTLGFDLELYKSKGSNNKSLDELLIKLGTDELVKADYFSSTKNRNEMKFENKSKDNVSSILIMIMNMWKQHIFYLNNEENRYLAELRDALLGDLMSGKIDLTEGLTNL